MSKDEKDRSYFERKNNTIGMLICAAVLAVILLVFCLVVWNLSHKNQKEINESKAPEESQENEVSDTVVGGLAGEESPEHSTESPGTEPDLPAEGAGEGSMQAGGEGQEAPSDSPEEQPPQDEMMTFVDADDMVTAKETTNLRSEPSTERSDTVVGKLRNGESVHRTGVNEEEGWSRLEYEGKTVYAASRLLTTDLTAQPQEVSNTVTTSNGRKITFEDWDDTVTAKIECNLRSEPSTSGDEETVVYLLKKGEAVHRTGMDEDSGWSRVEYEEQILYAVSSLLMEYTEEE